jgi:transposase
MKWNSRRVTAWAYTAPVDLRKGFDDLSAMVSEALGRDPLSGDLYLFVSRNRIRAKVLHWEGTGLCVYAKRLEKGKFASLWNVGDGEAVQLTTTELSLFLEGQHAGRKNFSISAGNEAFFSCRGILDMI